MHGVDMILLDAPPMRCTLSLKPMGTTGMKAHLTKRLHKDGLSCPTFSCDDIESRFEDHMLLLYQCKVPGKEVNVDSIFLRRLGHCVTTHT